MSSKRIEKADVIRLESLPCAAACMTSGCSLERVERLSPSRCEFYVKGADADLLAADFLLGKLEGNLLTFMRCFDDLRTAIRQAGIQGARQ